MKNLIFTFCLCLFGLSVQAQNRDFDGLWTGEIATSNNETISIRLYIVDNNVHSLTKDEDGDLIKDRYKEVSWSKGYGEQLNYVWMNKGGIWTETQVYSLVWINENKLSIHFLRHVSNESKGTDVNTDWGYTGKGFLHKE